MAKSQRKEAVPAETPPYEPTQPERKALKAYAALKAENPLAPRMKVSEKDGTPELQPEHPNNAIAYVRIMEALGTRDYDFLDGLLTQIANIAGTGKKVSERDLNFVLSVIKNIEPKDQLEAMLGAQMAAVHMASMTFGRRLAHVENLPQQDSASNAFNKLTRTFATQMETLKRYRTGGEQKVTVQHQHVTVNEGGKAIVGAVSTGGGASGKSEEQPHAKQIAYAPGETVPGCVEAIGQTVPSASR
jgi:hypothetical protein